MAAQLTGETPKLSPNADLRRMCRVNGSTGLPQKIIGIALKRLRSKPDHPSHGW
jgi:hypothetical protein